MKAERFYSFLMRLYPRGFREAYGEAMVVHFGDLWREARGSGGFAIAKFWLGIGADTLVAAARVRFSERRKRSTGAGGLNVMKMPSFGFLFVAFLAPLLIGLGSWIWLQPKIYMAQARMEVGKINREFGKEKEKESYDPYFLQTMFEVLKSEAVLERVVSNLDLGKRFGDEFHSGRLKTAEAVSILRSRIEVSAARNTGLIELRAYSKDPSLAANIANQIAASFQGKQMGKATVEVVDAASRPLKPVRPNVPLLLVMGSLMCGVLAGVGALLLRLVMAGRGNAEAKVAG